MDNAYIICQAPLIQSKYIDNTWVVLEQNRHHYRELNEVAGFIWGMCQEPISVSSLITNVVQEFAVPKNQASRDVKRFIQQYLSAGLLVRISK